MPDERRLSVRLPLPDGIDATISGYPVHLVELSRIGGRIEHDERFPLDRPQLRLGWRGKVVRLSLRVARSEIVSRRESRLVYQTGIQFADIDGEADGVIASILHETEMAGARPAESPDPPAPEAPSQSQTTPSPARPTLDDSWTRQVSFLRRDPEEDLIYVQFRLGESGWSREFVATPVQPEDGFTVRRAEPDVEELQKTFECADPETRRMMQIALESKLMVGA